jgi:glycosyltransferase involved in cell wall biosynthesis
VRKALNVVPWGQKYRFAGHVNARFTALAVRRATRSLARPAVLWVYDPCAEALAGACGETFAVYDCVDDYAEQAGPDAKRRQRVAQADAEIASRARLVFVTTRSLLARKRDLNPRTELVPNVGDYEHFAAAADGAATAAETGELEPPVLGFAGNLDPLKVDFALLGEVAAAHPEWSVVLVGPVQPGARDELRRLEALPNVVWLGPRPYEQLPSFVAAFDVGLIPYAANRYTESCFPLKLYEYLAAGKPVVASGLPELAGMGPDVALASDSSGFADAIVAALALRSDEDRRRRMALAARNTWETRTERLLELVSGELGA